jgi:hypothetical protein
VQYFAGLRYRKSGATLFTLLLSVRKEDKKFWEELIRRLSLHKSFI